MKNENIIPTELKNFIPIQKLGKYSDTFASLEINDLNNPDIAFKSIKVRLLDVNNWAHYATLTNTEFILLNENGDKIDGLAKAGYYMKVRFSRMQKIISAKHDYVLIKHISTVNGIYGEALIVQVQPAHNPKKTGSEIDHFFTDQASNTFLLYRDAFKIYLSIHGRNEQPNFNVSKAKKKFRNMVFALLGLLTISKVQWKSLAHGLLNYNEKIL